MTMTYSTYYGSRVIELDIDLQTDNIIIIKLARAMSPCHSNEIILGKATA